MKRQAMLNHASPAPVQNTLDSPTSNRGSEDGAVAVAPPQKPKVVRKDPIVLRLERIKEERLHKEEELQRMLEREEEERENQVTVEAQSAIEEKKKGKESPYRVKLREKGKGGQTKKKNGGRTPSKKKKQMGDQVHPPWREAWHREH